MAIRQGCTLPLMICTLFSAVSANTGVLNDPTRPIIKPKTAEIVGIVTPYRGWTLESTLIAASRRVALINGKLVTEGESVDGARVIKIRKLDVLVETRNQRITLQLLPDVVVRNP